MWKYFLSWVNCTLNQKKWATGFWDIVRWNGPFWPTNAYFRLKMAKMTCLKCELFGNVWVFFYDSKCNLLRKGSTLILPKRFIEIRPFSTTWKSTNFLYLLLQQKRARDNPHKILKMGSLHWVMIPCYEIQNSDLLQSCTCKSGQTIFLLR